MKLDKMVSDACSRFKKNVNDYNSNKPIECIVFGLKVQGPENIYFLSDIEYYFKKANVEMTEEARKDITDDPFNVEELRYVCDKIAEKLGDRVLVSCEIYESERMYKYYDIKPPPHTLPKRVKVPYKYFKIQIKPARNEKSKQSAEPTQTSTYCAPAGAFTPTV